MRTPDPVATRTEGLFARLRGVPGSEQEMAAARVVFAAVVALAVGIAGSGAAAPVAWLTATSYGLGALVVFVRSGVKREGASALRAKGLLLDLGLLAALMHLEGGLGAVLYPGLLVVIFANGFRFGLGWLRVAMGLGLLAFTGVVFTTPFWQDRAELSSGLAIGLVILPLYAGRLIHMLSQARNQAEAASRAKSLFLASVSHELRTPLNAIIGMGALLEETPLSSEQQDMARTMREAGRGLLEEINSILNFSRLEAGRMPRTDVSFDLIALLHEICGMLRPEAEAKCLRLGVHFSRRTPRMLDGDEAHLREILLHLGANAVKFTEAGHVVFTADAEARNGSDISLELQVIDSGIGIPADALERIFDPFAQADESILSRFGGAGVGLAVCKRLVGHLGGRIAVESDSGRGSRFRISLPMRAVAASAPAPSALARLPVLLLAEPGPRANGVMANLAELGARPVQYAAMADMLAALRQSGTRHPLVLIDGSRPGSNPDALAQALGRLDVHGRLTIVLLGAPPTDPDVHYLFAMILPATPAPGDLAAALALAATREPPVEAAEKSPAPAPGGSGIRVLVADDNRTNQRVIAKILDRAGYRMAIVEDGESALEALDREAFDIVLLDLNMPRLGGLEAVKLYRMSELGGPRRPVIALTADASPETVQTCRAAGMDACLTKPVDPRELVQLIASLLPPQSEGNRSPGKEPQIVTDISAHPQFRANAKPALDRNKLAELEQLGGRDFVVGLIDGFLEDAAPMLTEMRAALSQRDFAAFRSLAHSLASGAANIGGRRIDELCRPWSTAPDAELQGYTGKEPACLEGELERLRASRDSLMPKSRETG